MTILNLTPHAINIVDSNGEMITTFPPEPAPARLESTTSMVGSIGFIPISSTTFGETTGLPEPSENTYYIVSRLVMAGNTHRKDLLVPNDLLRNNEGHIVGCQSLANN